MDVQCFHTIGVACTKSRFCFCVEIKFVCRVRRADIIFILIQPSFFQCSQFFLSGLLWFTSNVLFFSDIRNSIFINTP